MYMFTGGHNWDPISMFACVEVCFPFCIVKLSYVHIHDYHATLYSIPDYGENKRSRTAAVHTLRC